MFPLAPRPRPSLRSLAVLAIGLTACGGGGAAAPQAASPANGADVRVVEGRPTLTAFTRDGDAQGALAVAVRTGGIAPERGAEVAVALAAIVQARLEAAGVREAQVIPGWDGYRVRALAETPAEAARLTAAIRTALLAPLGSDRASAAPLAAAKKKLDALARRPMADLALLDAVRCTGDVFAMPRGAGGIPLPEPTPPDLERWRSAVHGLGRVAFGAAGGEAFVGAVADALAKGEPWPARAPAPPEPFPPAGARAQVYDASGDVPPGGARVTISAFTASAAQAVGAAPRLGDPHGPLASRFGALEAPGKLRAVTAIARGAGGCLSVSFDLSPRDLVADAPGRVATSAALARQELAVQLAQTPDDPSLPRKLAADAGDPRDAAERGAWWTLSRADGETAGKGAPPSAPHLTTAIGVASTRDAPEGLAARAEAIRGDVDRATVAWHAPVVESRTRVERGQGQVWVLVGSTCGTGAEAEGDAGLGALVARTAAEQAARFRGASGDVEVEPWATAEGIGLVAHGGALAGEPPLAQARRLADVAGRSFAADPLDPSVVTFERARLLASANAQDGRLFAGLAGALAPGHPSWLAPLGTADALGRASDGAVLLRAAALRAGPLRVAVLANVDSEQAQAAVQAVDRWVARRPGEVRSCGPAPTAPPIKPGTYAVETAPGAPAEALLAFPLPAGDEGARASGALVAAALDGDDGLLARALGPAAPGQEGLARAWGARMIGGTRGAALVVRVTALDSKLDLAVAQARGLLDRLRQGALGEAERARAVAARRREDLASALDPRARLVALFRGDRVGVPAPPPPSLESLRAFASSRMRDEALVIVAARPPRSGGS